MDALRVLQLRAVRPHLSLRYRYLRRHNATRATPPPQTSQSTSSFFARNLAMTAYCTLALSIGAGFGIMGVRTFIPPPTLVPGSTEDRKLLADLNKRIDEEFKVSVLRGKCLGMAKQLNGRESAWVEIIPSSGEVGRLSSIGGALGESLQGSRGLAVERVFWDRGQKKLVAVVFFGPTLSGWPGVTHGGLLATALSDKIALANALAYDAAPSSVAEAASAVPQRLPGTGNHAKKFAPTTVPLAPAQLSLNYLKPTFADNFYVIRVQEPEQDDLDLPHPVQGHEWEAMIETPDAKICVKANAKFAPSSSAERTEKWVVDSARQGYAEFRQWMWPSRQQSSQIS